MLCLPLSSMNIWTETAIKGLIFEDNVKEAIHLDKNEMLFCLLGAPHPVSGRQTRSCKADSRASRVLLRGVTDLPAFPSS